MAGVDRVTVTLPNDLVRDIDRREKKRSKFVAEAVRNELDRRRRAELRRSLDNPHPESAELAGQGLEEWTRAACPRKMPRRSLTATLASRFGGSPARAGWRGASEWSSTPHWVTNSTVVRPCVVVSDPDVIGGQRFPLMCVVPVTGTPGEGLLDPPLAARAASPGSPSH